MSFLSPEEILKLEAKISAVEEMTSAEIKVIVCNRAIFGLQRKASSLFKQYGLHLAKERNAVLLLVVERNKSIIIYSDECIHQKEGAGYWLVAHNAILDEFDNGNYYAGLASGIEIIAENLIDNYPSRKREKNELRNEIVFV